MYYYSPYYLIPGSKMEDMRNIPNPKEPMPTEYFPEKEAFTKGNLFKEEYVPYKNNVPTPVQPKNEKEQLMNEIQSCRSVCHDLNLLLDVHPKDKKALKTFDESKNKLKKLIDQYEKKYGALSPQSEISEDNGEFSYCKTPSPWLGSK